MNPQRYKTLLTVLPGMASVVNSFSSPQVQMAVYGMLMEALDSKLAAEGLGRAMSLDKPLPMPLVAPNGDITHDLIEGDSIHSEQSLKQSRTPATVF